MRKLFQSTLLAGVCALALTACSKPAETATEAAPAADAMAGHDMANMPADMAASDTADDANTAETPEGFTFHTYPNKLESVHLPITEGQVWTAKASDDALVAVESAADEAMPDGSKHHVVKVATKASGNGVVTFEQRPAGDAAAAPTATRNVNFMIH
jgi:hypothetical protein